MLLTADEEGDGDRDGGWMSMGRQPFLPLLQLVGLLLRPSRAKGGREHGSLRARRSPCRVALSSELRTSLGGLRCRADARGALASGAFRNVLGSPELLPILY